MSDEDLWSTDSGLVSDYEGTVIDCWFAVDSNINDSPTFLFLKMRTDLDNMPEITERYNCGPDWKSYDGGDSIIHPTKVKFNKNSQAGVLVDKVAALVGKEQMMARGAPQKRETWVGLQFFMEAVEKPYKLRDGTEGVSVRNYPAKFLGVEDVTTAPSPREESAVGGSAAGAVDSTIMTIVATLAKELPHREWVDRVLEVDGVMADDELVRRLPDSTEAGLYETLRRGK